LKTGDDINIRDFELERYFARYEFAVKYIMSASDCESLPMNELLRMADPETLDLWKNLKLGYTESQGHPLLRKEISRLYDSIKTEEILTLAPEEGIFIAMNCVLKRGDHAVVTFPAYQSLYELANSLGCKITRWSSSLENGWELDLNFLENSIRKETRIIIVNFPQNPMGYMPSRKKFMDIVKIARDHDLFLFSDEMYRMLEYGSERLPPACDVHEKAISLSGLSKAFSLPGLRMGWLATKDGSLFKKIASFKDYTTICGSAPTEILAIMALRAKNEILSRNLEIIKRNIGLTEEFFSRHGELFSWVKPNGGSVAFPLLKSKTGVDKFCEDVLKKENMMILPGSVFDFPGNHFRIGLGRENFPACLKILEKYVKSSKLKRI
jgi:aspartate/methionine/tyrosine aminotransferase